MCHPARLLKAVVVVLQHLHCELARESLGDFVSAVDRAVVDNNERLDPFAGMKSDIQLDNVSLISDQQRHNDFGPAIIL